MTTSDWAGLAARESAAHTPAAGRFPGTTGETMTEPTRQLTTTTPSNVTAIDEPGPGGACHAYMITQSPPIGPDTTVRELMEAERTLIQFQKGPRFEPGSTTGVYDDDLLAIVEDRLIDFQRGQYACEENAEALDHVERARNALRARRDRRQAEGTLGTTRGT